MAWRIAVFVSCCAVLLWSQSVSTPQSAKILDLTGAVGPGQEGLRGIPGESYGSRGEQKYKLPLEVSIVRSWISEQGEAGVEVRLQNVGETPFDLPASQNLTGIEKPGNKAQRLFWLLLRPETDIRSASIGGVVVGGSTSVSGSLIELAPGESLRVLMRITQAELKTAFHGAENKELGARLVCHEWRLEEDRYYITASSDDVASSNAIKFVLQDGKAVPVQP